MAGVLELIGGYLFKGPQIAWHGAQMGKSNLTLLELMVAKEILQEVFAVSAEDVEEMIQQRLTEL
jgi:hypothetical protein